MGCAPSVVVAAEGERRRPLGVLRRRRRARRGRALRRYSMVSTTGLLQQEEEAPLGGRRTQRMGRKVAPEPAGMAAVVEEKGKGKEMVLPGSPSFRFYCEEAAAVAAVVAESYDLPENPYEVKKPPATQEITKSHHSSKVTECKGTRWGKLRGLTIATTAVYNWFSVKNCYSNTSAAAAATPHL